MRLLKGQRPLRLPLVPIVLVLLALLDLRTELRFPATTRLPSLYCCSRPG
jgi:hypothetical protein